MEHIFESIEDKKQLDQLLKELRAALKSTRDARDTARNIISRRIKQPEFVRTINRKLFPQFQQMTIEFIEYIAEVKEQRSNVQGNARDDDNSAVARPTPGSGGTEDGSC